MEEQISEKPTASETLVKHTTKVSAKTHLLLIDDILERNINNLYQTTREEQRLRADLNQIDQLCNEQMNDLTKCIIDEASVIIRVEILFQDFKSNIEIYNVELQDVN